MASPMDTFNALPKLQQAGIVGGLFLVVGLVLAYLSYNDLQRLGADPESKLPEFLVFEGGTGNLWGSIRDTETKIAAAQKVIDSWPAVKAELASLEDVIEVAEGLLPNESEKEQVREDLQSYAREVSSEFGDVKILSVSIQQSGGALDRRARNKKQAETFQSLTFSCVLETGMEGLIAYIDRIETSTDRFLLVKSMSLVPGTVTIDSETRELVLAPHQVDLDIVTYFYDTEGAQ